MDLPHQKNVDVLPPKCINPPLQKQIISSINILPKQKPLPPPPRTPSPKPITLPKKRPPPLPISPPKKKQKTLDNKPSITNLFPPTPAAPLLSPHTVTEKPIYSLGPPTMKNPVTQVNDFEPTQISIKQLLQEPQLPTETTNLLPEQTYQQIIAKKAKKVPLEEAQLTKKIREVQRILNNKLQSN